MIYLWAAGYGISAFSRINYEQVSSLETLFLSVILESLPFLLIGAFVSAVIEVFISEETIAASIAEKNSSRSDRSSIHGDDLPYM